MERLTKRVAGGHAWYNHQPGKTVSNDDLLARLAAYEDTGLTPENIKELISDIHALMWYGEGCEICAHKIVDERKPYRCLRCGLGKGAECEPLWRGLTREETALKGADNHA